MLDSLTCFTVNHEYVVNWRKGLPFEKSFLLEKNGKRKSTIYIHTSLIASPFTVIFHCKILFRHSFACLLSRFHLAGVLLEYNFSLVNVWRIFQRNFFKRERERVKIMLRNLNALFLREDKIVVCTFYMTRWFRFVLRVI